MAYNISYLATRNGVPYNPAVPPQIQIWDGSGASVVSTNMSAIGSTQFYTYNFSSLVYGTQYVYLITGESLLTSGERYRYGTIYQEFPDFYVGSTTATTLTTTAFTTNRGESVTGFWSNTLCTFLTGALAGQVQKVSAYDGSTKTITVASAFTGAPSAGDQFVLISR